VLDDVAKKLGGEVVRTGVGEPEIIGEYRRAGGDIGGEENGGVFFFDWLFCREGPMTAVKFLEALEESGGTVSELNASLPLYHQIKKRVRCQEGEKAQVMNSVARRFAGYKLDRTDGVRVMFEDGWLLIRPSGTEPVFRVFSEAKTSGRAEELAALGMKELKAAMEGLRT
jgi:phosphomannomutase/phosphoglucomutase